MKHVKLTNTAQIPDENHTGKGEPATATNYAGAVLRVGDALADQLVAAGKAELCTPPKATDEASIGKISAAVARTFGGREE